jgi:hypothetical protein
MGHVHRSYSFRLRRRTIPPALPSYLHEFDQIEWWGVARRINPSLTWEEFCQQWQEFLLHKALAARSTPPQ